MGESERTRGGSCNEAKVSPFRFQGCRAAGAREAKAGPREGEEEGKADEDAAQSEDAWRDSYYARRRQGVQQDDHSQVLCARCHQGPVGRVRGRVVPDNHHGRQRQVYLRLFDTDPDELFSRIRAITYKTTDIFVICFDLTNEDTFKNCRSWYAEVNQLSARSPVLLVGTKVDKKLPRIDRKVPEALLQDLLMLYNYIEVDATDPNNVKKLIELAVSHLSL